MQALNDVRRMLIDHTGSHRQALTSAEAMSVTPCGEMAVATLDHVADALVAPGKPASSTLARELATLDPALGGDDTATPVLTQLALTSSKLHIG